MTDRQRLPDRIRANIEKVYVGKTDGIDIILVALVCRGHVLIEDVPGTGKTTLVSTLSRSLSLSFRRIQFTPDVLPADITGFTMLNMKSGEFEFHPGAVMSQVVLADEINRTSPKTQAALLEVMQETQVTVDGVTHPLPRPFMVLATQNPIEYVGTYPLPEAQLDRFFVRVSLGYPSHAEEMQILSRFEKRTPLDDILPVADAESVLALQEEALEVFCGEDIKRYIADLALASRSHPEIALGASPRGALALLHAAKGSALLQGREYATPDDVRRMAEPVLAHRLVPTSDAQLRRRTPESLLRQLLDTVPVPGAR